MHRPLLLLALCSIIPPTCEKAKRVCDAYREIMQSLHKSARENEPISSESLGAASTLARLILMDGSLICKMK